MGPIVLLTDFGQEDGYVGIMKGVIQSIAPEAKVIDLAHHLPPQSVSAARFVLWNSYKYFPEGSIFVCVVDPGVGSERKIHVYQTQQHVFIVPDNGVLDYVLAEQGVRYAFELEQPKLRLDTVSHTFHGRDLFAPAAAHLANGFVITQVGPSILDYRIPKSPFLDPREQPNGEIIHIDRFGNLITNFKAESDHKFSFELGGNWIPTQKTYASVEVGEILALAGSHGLWEIACRNGNAAMQLDMSLGDPVTFAKKM